MKRGVNTMDKNKKTLSFRNLNHVTDIKVDELKNGFQKGAILSGCFIYLEALFHIILFHKIDLGLVNGILLSAVFGIFVTILTGLFHPVANKIIGCVIVGVVSFYYITQTVYYHVFQRFLNLFSIGAVGTDVLEFKREILTAIKDCAFYILLLLVPFIFLCAFHKVRFEKERWYMKLYIAASGISLYLVFLLGIRVQGKGIYAPFNLYYGEWVQELGTEKLGLLETVAKDIKGLIGGNNQLELEAVTYEDIGFDTAHTDTTGTNRNSTTNEESMDPIEQVTPTIELATTKQSEVTSMPKPLVEQPTESASPDNSMVNRDTYEEEKPKEIDRSPNVLNLSFESLIEGEKNKTVKALHEYFSKQQPTNKNEYTGMFKGYNLIMLTAEGFSPYAVDEELTPTLYKLTHEGFVFENFYTPLWWCSTSDGEYVACTSRIPKGGVTSMYVSGSNDMPFCLGNQFSKLGYQCNAYHDHTYTYYHRDVSHPNMGYEYKARGNGLELKETWPESDLEMMEKTIPEYVGKEPFHTYYMTVSGHMNYTFMGNYMSYKHRDEVKELPYSEEARAYKACNLELDQALQYLIEQLEKEGVADRTVIALSADHYPYGLEKDIIDEMAGHEVEENFELYENYFILWNPQIKEPIVITKPCSSLDILPTLSNLFGLNYDSRLLMGRDILSDSEPLVMFSNRSFITDKVMYNSKTKEVMNLTEEELPEGYVDNMIKIVKNKFAISVSMLEEDYYRKLETQLTEQLSDYSTKKE